MTFHQCFFEAADYGLLINLDTRARRHRERSAERALRDARRTADELPMAASRAESGPNFVLQHNT